MNFTFNSRGKIWNCSLKPSIPTSPAMRPFLPTIQTLQLVITSVRISLVDSTVRNNRCHPSFDSNVKYESNNITASSSRPYHAGILIFWLTRTVIRKWSPCFPHNRDRWPAAEWKQYCAGWGGWRAYGHKIFEYMLKKRQDSHSKQWRHASWYRHISFYSHNFFL